MIAYERIMLTRRVHYIPYWIAVGAVLFAIEQVLIRALGESGFFWVRLLVAYGGLCGIVITLIYMSRSFRAMMSELASVIEPPVADYGLWVEHKTQEIFSFTHWAARLMSALFVVGVTSTILLAVLPFRSSALNAVWIIGWQPFLIVSGHAAYSIIAGLDFLTQIVRYPVKVPFYRPNHPAIQSLSAFYSRAALVVLVFYIGLIAAVWTNPYGFTAPAVAWILVTGFLPLSLFLWSFFQIHGLLRRIKQINLDTVNQQVQVTLTLLQTTPSKENAEALAQIMDIQKKVEQEPEWPFTLEEIFTLIATAVAPISQIVNFLLNKLHP
jgi:hypothetical protein